MLDQVMRAFGLTADRDLGIMVPNQTLDHIVSRALTGVGEVLDRTKPDLVLVQGDTTTAFAAALAAYHRQIRVGHVEAGLRSFDKRNPFPEEVNRIAIDAIADFCFAPTAVSRKNLLASGIAKENIFLTGNTVVDALLHVSKTGHSFSNSALNKIDFDGSRVILLTAHRRENYITGELERIIRAVNTLVCDHPDLSVVFPLHPNPNVRTVVERTLQKNSRVHVVEPLEYADLVTAMRKSYLLLTDSGGIQEEGPTFGKPVLVLRKTTERPEGITAGIAKLVGTDPRRIIREVEALLKPKNYRAMAKAKNPYGDGTAARQIVSILEAKL
jgi:UDP-N-acetylglucosamine 2-epimerase (non-hydrolysing)